MSDKRVMVYKAQLRFNVFQVREELLGIRLENCDDVDAYVLQIKQAVTHYNLCSEPSTSS